MKKNRTPQIKPTDELSVLETIKLCGKLQYPIDKVVNMLRDKVSAKELCVIKSKLETPDTQEYNVYISGQSVAEFEQDNALYERAIGGDIEAIKLFKETQLEKNVNEAIKNQFFSTDN